MAPKTRSNKKNSAYEYGYCSDNSTTYPTAAICNAGNKTWTFYSSASKSNLSTKATCKAANKTWNEKRATDWQGCVTNRDLKHTDDNDTTKVAPNVAEHASMFLAKNYADCKASIMPMKPAYKPNKSDNYTDDNKLKGKINNLTPVGGTNQPISMRWAWMSLQTGDPLNTPAKETDYKYNDTIIFCPMATILEPCRSRSPPELDESITDRHTTKEVVRQHQERQPTAVATDLHHRRINTTGRRRSSAVTEVLRQLWAILPVPRPPTRSISHSRRSVRR